MWYVVQMLGNWIYHNKVILKGEAFVGNDFSRKKYKMQTFLTEGNKSFFVKKKKKVKKRKNNKGAQ